MELMKLQSVEGKCYMTLPIPSAASSYYSCAQHIRTCLKFDHLVLLLHVWLRKEVGLKWCIQLEMTGVLFFKNVCSHVILQLIILITQICQKQSFPWNCQCLWAKAYDRNDGFCFTSVTLPSYRFPDMAILTVNAGLILCFSWSFPFKIG